MTPNPLIFAPSGKWMPENYGTVAGSDCEPSITLVAPVEIKTVTGKPLTKAFLTTTLPLRQCHLVQELFDFAVFLSKNVVPCFCPMVEVGLQVIVFIENNNSAAPLLTTKNY